jgi:hypothetical protein
MAEPLSPEKPDKAEVEKQDIQPTQRFKILVSRLLRVPYSDLRKERAAYGESNATSVGSSKEPKK